MDLSRIQSAIRERRFDAWLFYDHHYRDPIGYRILGLPDNLHVTRRWYYVVPASGDPHKLVHRIEAGRLDPLPGQKNEYSSWQEQHENLKAMLAPYKNVAMQFSPNNAIPYVSLVDGGTIDLIRSFGKNIVSSCDLVTEFDATLSDEQIVSHFAARDAIDPIMQAAFAEIGRRCANGSTTEFDIQQFVEEAFRREKLVTDSAPIVAVNENSANPHYAPSKEMTRPIKKGDFILLDFWAKKNQPNSVFYDITWTGVVGRSPSDREIKIFETVWNARDAGLKTINASLSAGRKIPGWEVDKAVRDSIGDAGYAKYFVHRTGHSIGTEVHANGANMDNFETKDEREILDRSLFSLEPGIYLPQFGVRLEYDVLVRNGKAEPTGPVQTELVVI